MIEYVLYFLLLLILIFIGFMGYCYYRARGGRCNSKARLDGKTVIITGANTGLGKETAKDLAKRGATIVMACRDTKKGEAARKEVIEFSGNSDVYLKKLDLGSLASIKAFASNFLKEFKQLHILINNAGIMLCPHWKTEDGFEMQFGVNHLGHFALTNLLLERMVESGPARIVSVSSYGHYLSEYMNLDDLDWKKNPYNDGHAYGQSKIANILFTLELHKRLADKKVTSYVLHPGVVNTELSRHSGFSQILFSVAGFCFKTPEEGAQTSIYCAVQEGLESKSGRYFSNCDVDNQSKLSQDEGLAKKLWEKSEEMTGIKYPL